METATAEVLARLDAERRVPTSGLWLYAIMRALGKRKVVVFTDDLYPLIWLALATARNGGTFDAYVSETEEHAIRLQVDMAKVQVNTLSSQYPPKHLPDGDGILNYIETVQPLPPFEWSYRLMFTGVLITPIHEKLEQLTESRFTHAESVVIGGTWRLHGGRKLLYATDDREKLIAILLEAMQPTTVALGMNVVFDGKMKPPQSKINFSGTGGQIGEGDVLICHPDDLNRYTPLPGAVALVLGAVTEPVQAFTCAVPVGDNVLTIVIK